MHSDNKLRNTLIRKIQHLPADKLKQVDNLLNEIEDVIKAKEKTLQLAGSWKEMDNELFNNLTTNLHHNRNNDRQIISID